MKSTFIKLLAGLSLLSVPALGVVPAGAATLQPITGGNVPQYAPNLDGWSNLAIVDTNSPISGSGFLTSWSFFAGGTGSVELLVVRPSTTGFTSTTASNQIVYVSQAVNVATTGVVVTETLPNVWVQQGDYVGLYFVESKGVVPFTGCNCVGSTGSVYYTAPDSTSPSLVAVGNFLTYGTGTGTQAQGGAVSRVYSFSVSGVSFAGADCKGGGYSSYFSNQGACVSFFASNGYVPIGSVNSSWNQ